jgi:hypothetical protein
VLLNEVDSNSSMFDDLSDEDENKKGSDLDKDSE